MRAAILRELGRPLTIENIDIPKLGQGHVLVQMELSAVCHSQRLEVLGLRGPDRFLPHLVGHEGVGRVLDIGAGVTKVKKGDRVVLSWLRGSGIQNDPIQYGSSQGTINAGPIATFCETPVVAEQCVVKISDSLEAEEAVLAGCALPTGAGTVINNSKNLTKNAICILGAGGVGLSAIAGAVTLGWKTITVVDLKEQRLAKAREIGATHGILGGTDTSENEIMALTNKLGYDLVIECAGAKPTMEMALRLGKTKGGHVVIAGNLATGKKFEVDPFDLIRGRTLTGSWGGSVDLDRDIPLFIQMIQDGKIPTQLLLGNTFSLDQVNEGLAELESGNPGRPVIKMGPLV